MTSFYRFIVVAAKKYAGRPDERAPAVKMLLRNAVRLAVHHLGRTEAEDIFTAPIQEARK